MFVELYNYLIFNAFDIWQSVCMLVVNCLNRKA